MSDEQFLTSPFLPRFHLFSHKLNFFEGALRAPLGPPGPGALAPATPLSRWADRRLGVSAVVTTLSSGRVDINRYCKWFPAVSQTIETIETTVVCRQ